MRRAAEGPGDPGRRPTLHQAVALGLLQGPTELLPVSSSGHTALVPWLAGWSYAGLDPQLRKSFEVCLHAGAGLALTIEMRGELIESARELTLRRAAVIALSLLPPVLAGYALERPIERRLGGPRSIAAGLVLGAAAMAMADRRAGTACAPQKGGWAAQTRRAKGADRAKDGLERGTRREEYASPGDGLALGLAQAVALIPGVSRNGATLAAARARGFARADAWSLSWHAALPVILGASVLKAWRMAAGGVPREAAPALAAGGCSAFVSTLASARLLRGPRTSGGPLAPYALYRCALAAIVLLRAHARALGLRSAQNMSG